MSAYFAITSDDERPDLRMYNGVVISSDYAKIAFTSFNDRFCPRFKISTTDRPYNDTNPQAEESHQGPNLPVDPSRADRRFDPSQNARRMCLPHSLRSLSYSMKGIEENQF